MTIDLKLDVDFGLIDEAISWVEKVRYALGENDGEMRFGAQVDLEGWQGKANDSYRAFLCDMINYGDEAKLIVDQTKSKFVDYRDKATSTQQLLDELADYARQTGLTVTSEGMVDHPPQFVPIPSGSQGVSVADFESAYNENQKIAALWDRYEYVLHVSSNIKREYANWCAGNLLLTGGGLSDLIDQTLQNGDGSGTPGTLMPAGARLTLPMQQEISDRFLSLEAKAARARQQYVKFLEETNESEGVLPDRGELKGLPYGFQSLDQAKLQVRKEELREPGEPIQVSVARHLAKANTLLSGVLYLKDIYDGKPFVDTTARFVGGAVMSEIGKAMGGALLAPLGAKELGALAGGVLGSSLGEEYADDLVRHVVSSGTRHGIDDYVRGGTGRNRPR